MDISDVLDMLSIDNLSILIKEGVEKIIIFSKIMMLIIIFLSNILILGVVEVYFEEYFEKYFAKIIASLLKTMASKINTYYLTFIILFHLFVSINIFTISFIPDKYMIILDDIFNKFNEGYRQIEGTSGDPICIICFTDLPTYFANRCNHYLFCSKCYSDNRCAIDKIKNCPICRRKIQNIERI